MNEAQPVINRCMGCVSTGAGHSKCDQQVAAERLVHRAVELLEFLANQTPYGPTPGVRAVLDEYRERFQ